MSKCFLFHKWDLRGQSFFGDGLYVCKKCGCGKIEYVAGAYSMLSKDETYNIVNKDKLKLINEINETIELNERNNLRPRIPNLAIELLKRAVEELNHDH